MFKKFRIIGTSLLLYIFLLFLLNYIFTNQAFAQTCTEWWPTVSYLESCANPLFQLDCTGSGTTTGTGCCLHENYDYCQSRLTSPPLLYFSFQCCNNPPPTPTSTPVPTNTPTPTPTPTPAGCQTNTDCGVCKQCCAGSPNYCSSWGYYCDGSIISECWATPTPTPTGTPPPGDCSSPPAGCTVTAPNWCYKCTGSYCASPNYCTREVYYCDPDNPGAGWQYQYPDCPTGAGACTGCSPGATPTPTPNGTPPATPTPPPIIPSPPPVFQTIMEVRNVTKGEQFVNDCGGYSCNNQPSWPTYCSAPQNDRQCGAGGCPRILKTQTQALLGHTLEVRICERNLTRPEQREIDASWWLNQVELPGEKTVVQAGENIICSPGFSGCTDCDHGVCRQQGNYIYHAQFNHPISIPYDWFKWSEYECGSPGGGDDYWAYACVQEQRFQFTVKNDSGLLNKTISAHSSVKRPSYVKPADHHRVESGCNLNWGTAQGFYDRQPECCWGDPTKQEGWYGWCTALDQPSPPPGYSNCRFGTCNTGEYSEDFFFWSNWVKINVIPPIAPWIQVTGDVHSNKRIRATGGP